MLNFQKIFHLNTIKICESSQWKKNTSFKKAIKVKKKRLNWPNFCDAIFEKKKRRTTKYTIITVIFHINKMSMLFFSLFWNVCKAQTE